jgi:hypothetical protein
VSVENYGSYFERSGRSAAQGAIAPAEEYFEGTGAQESLARETGQNSIDAVNGDGPVTMVFELAEMETDAIPGIEGLRVHLEQVVEATRDTEGHARMVDALEYSRRDTVHVLRIGDYGTNGLTGSESIDSPTSPLSALTRGAGISANDGTRGGSFGIGSAVEPMASNLCTVLYTSQPIDRDEIVFAGYSRLASHRDGNGGWRVGDGFYTDIAHVDDFRYKRDVGPIGPFPLRAEPGTDIYVLAYRSAENDPDLAQIRASFVTNFMNAIDRGLLIVHGITAGGKWKLNAGTLEHYARDLASAYPFYRAIKDEEPIVAEHPKLGEIKLYINLDDSLDRSLHTIGVRRPLMRIGTYRHTSVSAKYAAVFECSNSTGNRLLRALEPPQHHEWDPARAIGGHGLVADIKSFIREGLKSRVKQQLGDRLEIKGLARFLPADLLNGDSALKDGGVPAVGDGTSVESASVQGAEGPVVEVFNKSGRSVPVTMHNPATAGGEQTGQKGQDSGGDRERKSHETGLEDDVTPGDGRSRIAGEAVKFRSWSVGSSRIDIAMTTEVEMSGDLELAPLGPGGTLEDGYTLPITKAFYVIDGEAVALSFSGNVLRDLTLGAETTRLTLELSSSHRYRLGVK